MCLKNLKSKDKVITCNNCYRTIHTTCIQGDKNICKNVCKPFKVITSDPKNINLINKQCSRRSIFYERLLSGMKNMFVPVTNSDHEIEVTKQLESVTDKNPHLKAPLRAPVAGPKEWIDEVNKKAKVNTVVDEVECNVIAQEVIEEIFNDACGVIEDNEAKRKRQSKNTIDQLFKRMKESQTSEKPARERGVENRRLSLIHI